MSYNFLCISSYFKGGEFLRACHASGNRVLLITSESLRNADWPHEALEDIFFMEEIKPYVWNMDHLTEGVAHFMRNTKVDRIVALDDFDVEKAAHLREVFRIPGMGNTTQRYFRDKLAMRQKAKDENIAVPPFSGIFNDDAVHSFISSCEAPWVLKPRSEASATGIQKIANAEQLWSAIRGLDARRHEYLVEQFRPGAVFHVDTLSHDDKVLFSSVSRYLATPMEVAHGGGIFRTMTLAPDDPDRDELIKRNKELLKGFGLQHGASHSEFIRGEDGQWYFLETSARVGGAFIANKIKYATGIDLWAEWAHVEHAVVAKEPYQVPPVQVKCGGLLVALAKTAHPDLSFLDQDDSAIALEKEHHVAFMLRDSNYARVEEKLNSYARHVAEHHLHSLPPSDHSTN